MKFINSLSYSKPIILDIGSGYAPTPDCYHIDVRDDLPDIDLVIDISKESLPIACNSVDGIVSNHVVEHFRWTQISSILKDWLRVLKVCGWVKIRTPDLDFIINGYVNGPISKEWPGDEDNAKKIFGSYGPSEWALIKLFSGQDYEANVHYACYSFDMLSRLLKNVGFSDVKRVKFDQEYSPGELQVIAYK